MSITVTASMLYDLEICPHRVAMDAFTDPTEQDTPNEFVKLLWERGLLHEQKVMEQCKESYTDLSKYESDEKERRTLEAMQRGESLIYGGRIRVEGLLGDPDLLRKECDAYIAGDIKSGAGEEGFGDSSKPKKRYAVQLGLYTDILERNRLSAGRRAFIWDKNYKEIPYDFTALQGPHNPRTLWQDYKESLAKAQSILEKQTVTSAAYSSSVCKNCHWYNACLTSLHEEDDLTLIPELGRSKRDVLNERISTIQGLAEADIEPYLVGQKTIFPGIGSSTLEKFQSRANLITASKNASPYLKEPLELPTADLELFFDIEVDPIRDICYLHGFIERRSRDNYTEHFVNFFAEEPTDKAEKDAFTGAWEYMCECQPCVIYYYSKYERTIYRKLQKKYPDVCSPDEIESLFNPLHAVDLYFDVVLKYTEWPTRDYSIKTLADYLGFNWRDTHPSGAASIEWFDKWTKSGDVKDRQRILDYNEDDCRATRVLRDALDELEVKN